MFPSQLAHNCSHGSFLHNAWGTQYPRIVAKRSFEKLICAFIPSQKDIIKGPSKNLALKVELLYFYSSERGLILVVVCSDV